MQLSAAPPAGVLPATVHHFIGGEWVDAATGRSYENRSPWTGEVLSQVAAGDGEDVQHAVEVAHASFRAWAACSPFQRQSVFLRAAAIVERRRAELLAALAVETGCGRRFGTVQIDLTVKMLQQAAQVSYLPTGQILPSDIPGTRAVAVRKPLGVVAAIAPWNASLTLAGRAITGPIAFGNSVVLKPSEESPYTGGAVWAEIFAEAGLPAGVLNVVNHAPGEASAMGDELLSNRHVRLINFTGSTPTGRRLAASAGSHLKRTMLQLSGQNALIVLADAEVDYAVEAAVYGAFLHQGQVCMCARRIYVEEPVAAEFTAKLAARAAGLPIGDPTDPRTEIGPAINQWALAVLERRVDEAVAMGARVLAGGVAKPPCYTATVLVDVPDESELAQAETFGPIAIVESVDSAAAAVRRTNESEFGLVAAVITQDTYRGLELAESLDTGIVHVNDQPVNDEPHMPFGGVKDSGWGRFGLAFAEQEFTEMQWVTSRSRPRVFPA